MRGFASRQETILSTGVVAASMILAFLVVGKYNRKRKNEHKDKKDFIRHRARAPAPLPSHVERDMYKEERRQRMLPKLTMKRQAYDNVFMEDPDGNSLSTISLKKARWYMNKDLADWVSEDTIRLRFKPHKRIEDPEKAIFLTSPKANRCVVCGKGKDYMRFYVVPFCYRTLFPDTYKTHLSHDVVLTCADCHIRAEQASMRRRNRIESTKRKDPETALPQVLDRRKQMIQSHASALLKFRDRLPADRVQECESTVREWFFLADSETVSLTHEMLVEASQLECFSPNPKYIPGAELVVRPLLKDMTKLANFIRAWREHFLETQRPRFLPVGWSVDAPVECDKPSKKETK